MSKRSSNPERDYSKKKADKERVSEIFKPLQQHGESKLVSRLRIINDATLKFAPIAISLISLIIAIIAYKQQRKEDLPYLNIRYATVEKNLKAAGTPSSLLSDSIDSVQKRRIFLQHYFYNPLGEALAAKVYFSESPTVTESIHYRDFDRLHFILIENSHNTLTGQIELISKKTSYRQIPIPEDYKSLPDYRTPFYIDQYVSPLETTDATVILPALNPSDIVAVPIRFSRPRGNLQSLFNDIATENCVVEIEVKKIRYFDETLTVSSVLIPRPALETPTLIRAKDLPVLIQSKVDK